MGHPPDYPAGCTVGLVTFGLTGVFVTGYLRCSLHAKVAEVKRGLWPLQLLAWLFWRR